MLSSILTRMRPAGRIHVLGAAGVPRPLARVSACCGVLDLLGPPSLSSAAKLEAGGSRRGAGPPIGLLSRAIEFIPAAICVVGEGVTVAAEMAALGGKPDRFFAAPDKFNSILLRERAGCLRPRYLAWSSTGLEPLAMSRSWGPKLPCCSASFKPTPARADSEPGLFPLLKLLAWESMVRRVLAKTSWSSQDKLYDR